MSDKPYEKDCVYCHKEITMSKETGKWLPYELNSGKAHDWKKNGNGKEKKEITLEMVQKKLESIGIIINVERLMKQ
jgi:hypothetical protein